MRARTPILFITFSVLVLPYFVFASTTAPREISDTEIWTADQGPYEVLAPLSIDPGASLTIGPGTAVDVGPAGAIYTNGSIALDHAQFTSQSPSSTPTIVMGDDSHFDDRGGNVGMVALNWQGFASGTTLPPPPFINTGSISVRLGETLTIAPGAIIKASDVSVAGTLTAGAPSPAPPVIFTSALDDSAGGPLDGAHAPPTTDDWDGITIGTAGTVSLENVSIRYAGNRGNWGAIPSCNDGTEHDSPGCEAAITNFGQLAISDSNFLGSGDSDLLQVNGTAQISNSDLPGGILTLGGTVSTSSPAALPAASSVLFIPGTEASRLYMTMPDGSEKQVWEPSVNADLTTLAINADGSSANALYTKDIIGKVFDNSPGIVSALAKTFDSGDLEVYSGLAKFLDGLVASSTIKEWRAYPYDWRYDPVDVVGKGTETKEPDGSITRVYLAAVVTEMASASPTGKVTIVAHSNGGLVAKALVLALGADASRYIDRIIFVGAPQYGTPSAVGSMLHGDGQSLGYGLVASKASVRTEAQVLPDAYALLPSPAYFDHVSTPVVEFGESPLLAPFVDAYGAAIHTFGLFESFIDDGKGIDGAFDTSTINAPLPLSLPLIASAAESHQALDSWQPPSGIALTAIAGWGQLTSETLEYSKATNHQTCTRAGLFGPANCQSKPVLQHTEIQGPDGDNTVVTPSALGGIADAWYFNSKTYQRDAGTAFTHQDLTSAPPIQSVLRDLVMGQLISEKYIVRAKPSSTKNLRAIVSSHSPINLVATDADGNKTGVVPIPGSDLLFKAADIPDSSVSVESGEEYLDLPQEGSYTIIGTGDGAGASTLEVENQDETGSTTSDQLFSAIPTTASTNAIFSLEDGISTAPQVDIDGDGTIDLVASDTPAILSAADAHSLLAEQLAALTVRPGIKNRLLVAFNSGNYELLATLIRAQAGIKLTLDQAAFFLNLIDETQQ